MTPPDPDPEPPTRESSRPPFWDERYEREAHLFGTAPNAFVEAHAHLVPPGGSVVELGAGEGRNLIALARRGHAATLVDFSEVALRKAGALATAADVPLRTIQADVTAWETSERWDAVVVAFLHLLPEERPRLYRLVRSLLKEGGVFIGVFFRPEQITGGYASGGPSKLDRMVTPGELRQHFPLEGVLYCEGAEVVLHGGPLLSGRAAVAQIVYRKTEEGR